MDRLFYATYGEDRYLWELFGGKSEGFFVDVGAGNGVAGSVSYVFELAGWEGICVEPHPQLYLECLRHRARSRVLHVALSRRGSWSIGNFVVLLGNEEGSFLATQTSLLERLKREGKRFAQTAVPVAFLDLFLEAHSVPVDFVHVDVNGSEVDVLDGFDVARFRPRVLLVADYSGGSDPRIEDGMARAGYRRKARIAHKDVYLADGATGRITK